jgi:cytochrome c-type biogenesis protein
MPTALAASDMVFSGPLLVAILISAAAGLVSFFSPCCLPLVPGYLSYVAGMAGAENRALVPVGVGAAPTAAPARPPRLRSPRARMLLGAVLFVAGFAAVFTSYGVAFGALGSALLTHQQTLIRILGVITILLGLMFTGLLWRIPLAGRTFRMDYRPRAGLIGAPLVGVMFGLGYAVHRADAGCGAHARDQQCECRAGRGADLRLQRGSWDSVPGRRVVG